MLIAAIQAPAARPTSSARSTRSTTRTAASPAATFASGFLFRTDRGLSFVDRPGGLTNRPCRRTRRGAQLSFSPGRIEPTDPAFNTSRKPLAGEFTFKGTRLFVDRQPLQLQGRRPAPVWRFQPPMRSTETQRHQQAQSSTISRDIHARTPRAGRVGRHQRLRVLAKRSPSSKASAAHLITAAADERYSYIFEGNSQALDHILVTPAAALCHTTRARQLRVRRPGLRPRPAGRAPDGPN